MAELTIAKFCMGRVSGEHLACQTKGGVDIDSGVQRMWQRHYSTSHVNQAKTRQAHHRLQLIHCLLLASWSASSTSRHRVVRPATVVSAMYSQNEMAPQPSTMLARCTEVERTIVAHSDCDLPLRPQTCLPPLLWICSWVLMGISPVMACHRCLAPLQL